MQLLVVGSNPLMRRLVWDVVAGVVAHLRACGNAAEAVAIQAGYHPEFVLTDADGIQAVPRIRQAYPASRIIVLADYDDADLRAQALAAGASHYVLKEDMFSLLGLMNARA